MCLFKLGRYCPRKILSNYLKKWNMLWTLPCNHHGTCSIGYFQVSQSLCFKARLTGKLLIWKGLLIFRRPWLLIYPGVEWHMYCMYWSSLARTGYHTVVSHLITTVASRWNNIISLRSSRSSVISCAVKLPGFLRYFGIEVKAQVNVLK